MAVFTIPKDVKKVLDRLHHAGEEAYIVGGCVRDMLLGTTPDDWDITTSAEPRVVKSLFKRTIDTGLSHGTVTVLVGEGAFEVTTYRIDGKYEDHRKPVEVVFTPSLREDMLRRDFTINAMAYNEEEGVIDCFDGKNDLEKGIIRCVGVAKDRFHEDALRMLRAIRFSAKLGFEIEEKTYLACKELSSLIQYVSAERIQAELIKILISDHPSYVKKMVDTGLMHYIVPEFEGIIGVLQNNPYHVYTVEEHTYKTMEAVEKDPYLRLTMFFHDFGKGKTRTTDEAGVDHFYGHPKVSEEMAKTIMKRLKMDNKTIQWVSRLIRYHDERFSLTKKSVRKYAYKVGRDFFEPLIKIKRADIKGQNPLLIEKHLNDLSIAEEIYQDILLNNECLTIRDLKIKGNDLIDIGYSEGKEIGEILQRLLNEVLDDPSLNTYEGLIELAKQMK